MIEKGGRLDWPLRSSLSLWYDLSMLGMDNIVDLEKRRHAKFVQDLAHFGKDLNDLSSFRITFWCMLVLP